MKQSIKSLKQTYMHAFIIRKSYNYYILFLSHLRSCVLKLMSVLHEVICVGIEFQRDAPAKEKLVLNKSILCLGSIIDRDGALLLWQTKRSMRYWGARFPKALKTSTALFNISFSRSGNSPKHCSLASVVTYKSGIKILQLFYEENEVCGIDYRYSRPRQQMHRLGETRCEHDKIAFACKCLRSV